MYRTPPLALPSSRRTPGTGWGLFAALSMTLLCLEARATTPPSPPKQAQQIRLGGLTAMAWATSTLKSKAPGRYSVKNAFDGKLATAWVEGAEGIGDAESLHVRFDAPVILKGFVLQPGYAKSLKAFLENQIPGEIGLYDEQDERLGSFDLYFRAEERRAANGSIRCEYLARSPINLAPKLVVLLTPVEIQYVRLEFPIAARSHTPKYEDMAISEWTPILDRDDPAFTPVPLPPPLEGSAHLLRSVARGKTLDSRAVTPDFSPPDLFALSLPNVPSWAQEALREELLKQGLAPSQDALANLGKLLFTCFVHEAVTVQSLPEGVRLHGAPFILQRKTSDSPAKVETVYVFPILDLDKTYHVKQVGLRTSGLSGAHCENTLPQD